MNPQSYAERTSYRPPAGWYQRLNRIGVPLISMGLAPHDAVILEVRGRKTGEPRRLPILRTRHEGSDYLVALAGEAQWVKNVRAAGGDAVIHRGRKQRVHLEELASAERAGIIAAYLHAGDRRNGAKAAAKQAKYYFGLGPDPSIDDIRPISTTTRSSGSATTTRPIRFCEDDW